MLGGLYCEYDISYHLFLHNDITFYIKHMLSLTDGILLAYGEKKIKKQVKNLNFILKTKTASIK